jgi:hypothetical protein
MSITRTILIKSFVKPFYRQHAGLFVFLFIILFGAVGMVDGAGLQDFHFSLIQGMLKNTFLFLLVFFAWFLYSKKTEQFIINILRRPDHSFLHMLSRVENRKLFRWLLGTQFLMFLPVVFYIVVIFTAGIYLHAYLACVLILLYLISIIGLSAGRYFHFIQNPGKYASIRTGIFTSKGNRPPYWTLFIRHTWNNKKLLFAGIKMYSCVLLYGMVANQTLVKYDLTMIFLFFSIGILGHGLLIRQFRILEEERLSFYRTLPISIFERFTQYALLYFILLIPEFITIAVLTPKYLHLRDAIEFCFFSYSVLLFLNSLLFIQFFRMQDYLKILLCIYLVIYLAVLTKVQFLLCFILLVSSILIFINRYFQFERPDHP